MGRVDIGAEAKRACDRVEHLKGDLAFVGVQEQPGVAIYVVVSEILDDLSDEDIAALVVQGLPDSDPSFVREQRRELRAVAKGLLLSRVGGCSAQAAT